MTNRQQLINDGYIVFPAVIPAELCRRAEVVLNSTMEGPCRVWTVGDDDVVNDFHPFAQAFLEEQELAFRGWDTPFHVFNRRPEADAQFWHDDDQAQACDKPFGSEPIRRVFVCTYFTATTEGHSPLKVVADSHKGGHQDIRSHLMTMRKKTLSNNDEVKARIMFDHACLWSSYPGEQKLEVPAGTMIVVDERMLHANEVNRGYKRRPMALWWLIKDDEDRRLPGG